MPSGKMFDVKIEMAFEQREIYVLLLYCGTGSYYRRILAVLLVLLVVPYNSTNVGGSM